MKVNIKDSKTVNVKSIKTCIKVSDRFGCHINDQYGNILDSYEGYVPDFFPGNHYGDYVEIDIDLETGQILNWEKPSSKDVGSLFESE